MNLTTRTNVLFDLDGTLVDSRQAVAACYQQVFRDLLGRSFPPPDISQGEVYAMRPREVFSRVAAHRIEELHSAYQAAYPLAAAAHLRVFAGANRLIRGLVDSGRRPSLVTNKGLARTRIDLKRAGIDAAWFSAIVTSEDTIERKPDPAPVLLGLRLAKADPADALYVGDGPQDVLAARGAGLPAVAVTYGFYARSDLVGLNPDAWADSIEGLAQVLGVSLTAASGCTP
jgi:phosphoglycolate phosphatase-like HAD superfamily hydrolase